MLRSSEANHDKKSSRSCSGTSSQKRKLGRHLESNFLDALAASPDNTAAATQNDTTSCPASSIQLTNGAVQALHDCQEEFVACLTGYLRVATRNASEHDGSHTYSNDADGISDNETKRRVHVTPHHVAEATKVMGLHDLLDTAQCILLDDLGKGDEGDNAGDQPTTTITKKGSASNSKKPAVSASRKGTKAKSKHVTPEMETEQERLLQASLSRQLVPGKDHKE